MLVVQSLNCVELCDPMHWVASKALSVSGYLTLPPAPHSHFLRISAKPGLHLPITSTQQMSISGDHAVGGPIMG